jgi:hypothetical protein
VSDATVALEILDLALVPGSVPPVYAIGIAASRITLADQQRRAINVVWALLREGRVKRGDVVAVIGAGIAGVTAATYARLKGLRVALFEKYDDPFAMHQGSGRWVHPNIYEWPASGWARDTTSLPCMNWRAGTARDVVAALRTEWAQLSADPEIDWHPATEITALKPDGASATLIDGAGKRHGPYACVIMAVGFGEEPERREFDGKPYWRDDDLHQRLRHGGTVFVSGCGDGGLIDAIRVALRDFRHDWLSTAASKTAADAKLIEELLRIERDTPAFPDGDALTRATLNLKTPDAVTAQIKGQVRSHTKVILNSGLDGPFTRAACLINRFVVAELMKLGVITFHQGKVNLLAIKRIGSKFEIPLHGGSSVADVDVIVVRHGPQERPLKRFPDLDSALEPVRIFLRTYRAGVDRTRAVAWGTLPAVASANPVDLPPASSDAMAFLAQSLQDAVKHELAKRSVQGAIVSCEGGTHSIDVTVRIMGTREEQINVHFGPGAEVTFAHPQSSRSLTVNLTADVRADSGAVVPILAAKVPEVLHWILEEYT